MFDVNAVCVTFARMQAIIAQILDLKKKKKIPGSMCIHLHSSRVAGIYWIQFNALKRKLHSIRENSVWSVCACMCACVQDAATAVFFDMQN